MQINSRNIIIGFFAGALAILFFHQTTIFLWQQAGVIPGRAWGNALVPPLGVPAFLNSMFWGGIWGVVFTLIANKFPASWSWWLKGMVFALLGPLLFGWIVMPFIKNTPFFANGVPMRMFLGMTIQLAFGFGLASFICLINSRLKA
jgi:hypothetical protein